MSLSMRSPTTQDVQCFLSRILRAGSWAVQVEDSLLQRILFYFLLCVSLVLVLCA